MNEMLYGGLDIHKETITGCILDYHGNVIREHLFPVKKKAVEKFTEGISNAEITFAMEACGPLRNIFVGKDLVQPRRCIFSVVVVVYF